MLITSIHIQDEDSLLNDFRWASDKPINILIGENGSGKTSLLKYLIWIFIETRNKYVQGKSNAYVPFKFSISYLVMLNDKESNIESNTEYIEVNLNNLKKEKDPWSLVTSSPLNTINNIKDIFPENIIAYYNGWDNSIKWLFKDVEDYYKELMRENPETKLNFGYSRIETLPLLYIQKIHFDILLACMFSYEYNFKLNEKLEIDFGIIKQEGSSIVVFINKPLKIFKQKSDYNNFWGASGEIQQFLENIRSRALDNGYYDNEKETYTFAFNLKEWYDLKDFYGSEKRLYYYFHLLNSTGLLFGFQIFFEKNGQSITNRDLSEGEQQILTILGIKELLLERNTLLLFDEPDTFLHPTWQEQFIPYLIDDIFDLPINEMSHFEPNYFITTHSPNLLKNANKEFVKVHTLEKGEVLDYFPSFYGRTIREINYNLMNVEERPKKIKDKLIELFRQLEIENIKESEELISDLVSEIGGDDKDILTATTMLEFLKSSQNE